MMLVERFTALKSIPWNPENFQFMILSKKSYQPQNFSLNTFTIDKSNEVEWPKTDHW